MKRFCTVATAIALMACLTACNSKYESKQVTVDQEKQIGDATKNNAEAAAKFRESMMQKK